MTSYIGFILIQEDIDKFTQTLETLDLIEGIKVRLAEIEESGEVFYTPSGYGMSYYELSKLSKKRQMFLLGNNNVQIVQPPIDTPEDLGIVPKHKPPFWANDWRKRR